MVTSVSPQDLISLSSQYRLETSIGQKVQLLDAMAQTIVAFESNGWVNELVSFCVDPYIPEDMVMHALNSIEKAGVKNADEDSFFLMTLFLEGRPSQPIRDICNRLKEQYDAPEKKVRDEPKKSDIEPPKKWRTRAWELAKWANPFKGRRTRKTS